MTRRRHVRPYLGNLFCFQEFSFCSIVRTQLNSNIILNVTVMRLLLSPFAFIFRPKWHAKFFIPVLAVFVVCGVLIKSKRGGTPIAFNLSSVPATNPLTREPVNDNMSKERQENEIISGINVHTWYDFCPSPLHVLCYHPLFPKAPDEKAVITALDVTRSKDKYAQRIFGFLHPPKTGKYKLAIASDDLSELWLSAGEDPSEAVLICSLGEWTTRDNFQQSLSQISDEIELKEDRKYFLEILHVQLMGVDFLQVAWSVPGTPLDKFETISNDSLSLILSDSGTLRTYDITPDSPACKSRPHHRQRTRTETKATPQYLSHEVVRDVLPCCEYTPSYLTKKKVPDGSPQLVYDFRLKDHFIPVGSYPASEYRTIINKFPEFGDHHLDTATALKVARIYMESLHQRYLGLVNAVFCYHPLLVKTLLFDFFF